MKIISILGSPNGESGNTGILLAEVLKGAESAGAECETVTLKGSELRPCCGCNICHRDGVCCLNDDFESIKAKILAADGIILATPNYISHVSAQLKVFLDRCAGLVHCMSLEGKYGGSVVTSGGGDELPIVEYLNRFLTTAGATPVDSMWAAMGTTRGAGLDAKTARQAFNMGRNIAEACKNNPRVTMAEKVRESHGERMRGLIAHHKNEWPYEYDFWQKKTEGK